MKQAETSPMRPIITESKALQEFCERLGSEPFITVDTEFMREKTYYPILCLVQVAGAKEAVAIDPLAPGLDLAPLYSLLANPKILKVFHACSQDMEIFYTKMGSVPSPIFDTQIAAMVCGMGESIGYESIVNKLLGLPVDKSSRFTDWSKRPLTDKQLAYALDDVIHLHAVYRKLKERLEKDGRSEWIAQDMQELTDPKTYEVDPNEVWRKFRIRNTSSKFLASLQAVARWRELTARAKDVPRGRVMKDETLVEVAQSKPENYSELQAIRGFHPTMSSSQYDALFASMREAALLTASEMPKLENRKIISDQEESLIDLLRLLLKACAMKHKIVPRLLADRDEIEALACGKRDGLHVLTGWRRELFGERALQLLSGKIALKASTQNGIDFIDVA